jgi:hypothetical protein
MCRRQAHATAGHQSGPGSGGETVMPKATRFDATDYLDSDERQAAYITAALETGEADFVRDALGIVARARGMAIRNSARSCASSMPWGLRYRHARQRRRASRKSGAWHEGMCHALFCEQSTSVG